MLKIAEALAKYGPEVMMGTIEALFKPQTLMVSKIVCYFLENIGHATEGQLNRVIRRQCITVFPPLLNGLLDAANLLKHVQHVRRYFCA
jgi:hypothetical protein